MSLKNSSDIIGKGTRDLPVCSVVELAYTVTEINHTTQQITMQFAVNLALTLNLPTATIVAQPFNVINP